MSGLQVQDLTVHLGENVVVDSVSFDVAAGEHIGVVGESGSGKSMTCLAILGLLPRGATVSGDIRLEGRDLLRLSDQERNEIRGARIGCVFQEPQTALNPVMRVGHQLTTASRRHQGLSRSKARRRAVELAEMVDLPDPERVVDRYPHELSGGQRQRVVIAMAMSCHPQLLLADEPTSALDATVQARVLDLMSAMTRQQGTAVVMVTHDMAVAARTCERILVMRRGQVLEQGAPERLLQHPQEEYTAELVAAARATSLDLNSAGGLQ